MPDKFHEECGVFAIYGHPEASKLAYLGLYALQHRGQESAGICVERRQARSTATRSMGMWRTFSRREVLRELPGELAIGHTRYSTAGDTALLNAQPFSVACNKGRIAVAHNGNITNAARTAAGTGDATASIFQASSDTEVILHLVAHSRERTLAGALRDALLQLEGAFSLVFLAEDRIIVARDPHGFRPLAMGQMELSGGTHLLRVRVGDLRVRSDQRGLPERCGAGRDGDRRPGGRDARALCAGAAAGAVRLRARLFFASGFDRVRPPGAGIARECWAACWRAKLRPMPISWCRCPIRASRRRSAIRRNPGIPFRQALIRNHYVGRTFIEPSQAIRDFGVKLKLNPVRHLLEGKRVVLVDDSIVRGTTSRKIVRMVRQAGAREVHMRISCPPTVSPCFYGVDTPHKSELIAANNTVEEIRRFVEADSLGICRWVAARGGGG